MALAYEGTPGAIQVAATASSIAEQGHFFAFYIVLFIIIYEQGKLIVSSGARPAKGSLPAWRASTPPINRVAAEMEITYRFIDHHIQVQTKIKKMPKQTCFQLFLESENSFWRI